MLRKMGEESSDIGMLKEFGYLHALFRETDQEVFEEIKTYGGRANVSGRF